MPTRSTAFIVAFAAVTSTAALAAAEPPPPEAALPAAPDAPRPLTVHVSIPDSHLMLFGEPTPAKARAGALPSVVCDASCVEVINAPPGRRFYFDAYDAPASRRFRLDGWSGDVHIDVKPGKIHYLVAGAGLLLGGAVSFVVAGVAVAQNDETHVLVRSPFALLPLLIVGVGAVAGGSTIVYFGTTRVTIGPEPAPKRDRDVGRVITDGLLRGGTFVF